MAQVSRTLFVSIATIGVAATTAATEPAQLAEQILKVTDVRGFVLHWDPDVMAELKRRGAIFRDFPTDLDKLIAGLHQIPREEVERVYTMSKLFYFDHVDDPQRRTAFENRLRADD